MKPRATLSRRRNYFERVTRWMKAGLSFAKAEVAALSDRRRFLGRLTPDKDTTGMSVITNVILICSLTDRRLAETLQIEGACHDPMSLGIPSKHEYGGNKVITLVIGAAALNYADTSEDIARQIESLSWEAPESVLLMVKREEEERPSVWGFAGARYFGSVDEPRRMACLVEAVPS